MLLSELIGGVNRDVAVAAEEGAVLQAEEESGSLLKMDKQAGWANRWIMHSSGMHEPEGAEACFTKPVVPQ